MDVGIGRMVKLLVGASNNFALTKRRALFVLDKAIHSRHDVNSKVDAFFALGTYGTTLATLSHNHLRLRTGQLPVWAVLN